VIFFKSFSNKIIFQDRPSRVAAMAPLPTTPPLYPALSPIDQTPNLLDLTIPQLNLGRKNQALSIVERIF